MSTKTSHQQKVYTAKELAVLLGIQNSTVRKYSQMLEKSGYHIHKNNRGHRGFFDEDVILFRRLVDLTKNPDMTLERAIKAVLSTFDSDDISNSDTKEVAESPYITKEEFKQYHQQQYELQKTLFEEIEKRDLLLKEVRDTNEQSRLLLAATKENESDFSKMDKKLVEVLHELQEMRKAQIHKRWGWKFWKW